MSQQNTASIPDLSRALQEARARTLDLVADLSDEQMLGPHLDIVNPLRWEIAHVAWFQEYWVLRHLRGLKAVWDAGDQMYDSARIAHDTRWDLPLPSKGETLAYMQRILDRVLEYTAAGKGKEANGYDEAYFLQLVLFHEDMHAEAITYTRQTLAYPPPRMNVARDLPRTNVTDDVETTSSSSLGDVEVPGGMFWLGSTPNAGFIFDNEMRAHPVEVKPFAISRTAVTNAEFVAFVSDGGYHRREYWDAEGWQWRELAAAEYPVYWRTSPDGRWLRRNFDQWIPLEDSLPVLHVNWHEAAAYCRYAGRRLPTEAEWEISASAEVDFARHKRLYPWGESPAGPELANLDWRRMGCVPVQALPSSESAFGCRQMIGNTWEWTATAFEPFPGFVPGPYKEYSAPWFGDHKVVRGGCWTTRSRLIRNQYRNFYKPDRRDVWAGFRTCALSID
jgi:iron(II)-dependent oxidoreductase